MTEHLVGQLGYVGITLILILGGLGLPIPEEAPIILAGVLTRNEQLWGPLAMASCLIGVLLGDMVVYFLGFFYGEKVLSLPLTRRVLTRQWEAQIKGYFHRHGFKILVSGRFVPGFRTAAYLTAGILKLPTLKLLLTDLVAASLSTSFMFGLGYASADQVHKGIRIREVQLWVTIVVALGVAIWLLFRYYKARRRAGLPVGPPVLESDDIPLPSADLRAPLARPAATIEPGLDPGVRAAETTAIEGETSTTAAGAASDGPPGRAEPGMSPQPAAPPRCSYDPVAVEASRSQPRLESPSR
ncbi:MAG: VTT domain-containing protein [Isosphaerales bacterium]